MLHAILEALPACLLMRVVLLEQHFRNQMPGSIMHYSLLNQHIRDYHEYLRALWRTDLHISYQGLLGLNRSDWSSELCNGVHLKEEAMLRYLCTVCLIIHSAYHLVVAMSTFLFQMPKQPASSSASPQGKSKVHQGASVSIDGVPSLSDIKE